MKLLDRIWLRMNKKEPNKWSYYSTIFFAGFATAIFLFIGIAMTKSVKPWVGWAFLALTILMVVYGFIWDYKKGYVDALHKRQIELWQEKRKKLGVK